MSILADILHDIHILETEEHFMTVPATPPEIIVHTSAQHQNNVEIHKHLLCSAIQTDYIGKIEKIEKVYSTEIYNGTIQQTATNMVMVYYSPPYGLPFEEVDDIINMSDIHKHLLLLIKQLQRINICLFDISPNNMRFQFKNGEWMPVITNLSNAFIYSGSAGDNSATKTHCMQTLSPNTPLILPSKPLEVWIIRALLQTNATYLTTTLLEDVVAKHKAVTPNVPFLNQCNSYSYKKLAQFINHTTTDVIQHFWQPTWQKGWDIYGAMFFIAAATTIE